jgi:regulator of RNase E activity RraA
MTTEQPTSDGERSERLRKLYTGAVADVLDDLGLREQCLPADIRPLVPTMKVAGPVFTVRGRSRQFDDGKDPRYKLIEMLDSVIPGSVVVVDNGDEAKAAHWGELMSNTALAKGATGCVLGGGVRDCAKILELGFPVFRRYHSPLTAVHRFDITDWNLPIRIGGVPIAPGHFILGDIDGVLVIPADAIDEVLLRAESVGEREDIMRDGVQAGGSLLELFEKHRVF